MLSATSTTGANCSAVGVDSEKGRANEKGTSELDAGGETADDEDGSEYVRRIRTR